MWATPTLSQIHSLPFSAALYCRTASASLSGLQLVSINRRHLAGIQWRKERGQDIFLLLLGFGASSLAVAAYFHSHNSNWKLLCSSNSHGLLSPSSSCLFSTVGCNSSPLWLAWGGSSSLVYYFSPVHNSVRSHLIEVPSLNH